MVSFIFGHCRIEQRLLASPNLPTYRIYPDALHIQEHSMLSYVISSLCTNSYPIAQTWDTYSFFPFSHPSVWHQIILIVTLKCLANVNFSFPLPCLSPVFILVQIVEISFYLTFNLGILCGINNGDFRAQRMQDQQTVSRFSLRSKI